MMVITYQTAAEEKDRILVYFVNFDRGVVAAGIRPNGRITARDSHPVILPAVVNDVVLDSFGNLFFAFENREVVEWGVHGVERLPHRS